MTGAPVRTALPFTRSQLSSSRMLYARLHSKTPWAFRLRANKCPWYHLDSGKPALCGAFAPALSTVGLRRGLLMLRLRDDFSGGFGRTHTSRSLSWPLPTGYCFPSSQFTIFYFSIVYPGSIVKRQLSRRISFFSREMMRFSSREM